MNLIKLQGDPLNGIGRRHKSNLMLFKIKKDFPVVEFKLTTQSTSVTISMIFILRYIGNMYVYLPYTVTTQSTSVTLASSNIESYTKLKPVTQQGKY